MQSARIAALLILGLSGAQALQARPETSTKFMEQNGVYGLEENADGNDYWTDLDREHTRDAIAARQARMETAIKTGEDPEALDKLLHGEEPAKLTKEEIEDAYGIAPMLPKGQKVAVVAPGIEGPNIWKINHRQKDMAGQHPRKVGPPPKKAPAKTTKAAARKMEASPWILRGIVLAVVLLGAAGIHAFLKSRAAEPARKRFLPQSVLQKASEATDTNSSGDDVDKLNRALGERMQKLSSKLSSLEKEQEMQ